MDITDGVKLNIKPEHYFQVGDVDSRDYNLFLGAREAPLPGRQEQALYVPGRSGSVNRTTHNNQQHFSDRQIVYPFTIYNYGSDVEHILDEIRNRLMKLPTMELYDSWEGDRWYWLGKCRDVVIEDEFEIDRISGEVIFDLYSFKTSKLEEGHGIWDEINFKLDYFQEKVFYLPLLQNQILPFKKLAKGDMVTIGGWAQYRASGERVHPWDVEPFYEITNVRDQRDKNISNLIFDGTQYQLDDATWVRAQDIVQARHNWVDVRLVNTGVQSAFPDIRGRTHSGPHILGYTIERDGMFYNFPHNNTLNDKFSLNVGVNEFKIYGQGVNITFEWYKEMI